MRAYLKSQIVLILLIFASVFCDAQISGLWSGSINTKGMDLKIKVKFYEENGKFQGNIDIPQQGALGLRLRNITCDTGRVKFELELSSNNIGKFDGIQKDSTISGDYDQMGFKCKFDLKKIEIKIINAHNLPYKDEEVTFTNNGIKLCGTLSIPDTNKKNPAVILISGSGAQNRDEEIYDFPIFKVISDHLVKKGFAVLRYDDRGIGCSEGNIANTTHEEFTKDILSAINLLKGRKDIDSLKIGLLGHSEGGIVAVMTTAKSNDVGFIILVASPGDNGSNIIKEQTKKISEFLGKKDPEIKAELLKISKVHETVISDKGWDELRADLLKQYKEMFEKAPNEQTASIENKDIYIQNVVENMIQGYKNPWLKSFLITNPADYLSKVKCPVLAIFGEKDFQVDAKPNSLKTTAALKKANNNKFIIKTINGANHLFQKAKTGSPDEYNKLDKQFIPGFLDLISNWLINTTKK